MNYIADGVENGGLENGCDFSAYVEICGTENTGRIACTHMSSDPTDVITLTLGVYGGESDRVYTQYDFIGTKEEFYEYVRKPIYDYNKFYERLVHMSDRLNDYLRSL